MYKNIIGYGFLEKVENGHKCLIGFTKSKRDVNFQPSKPDVKSSPDVNLSSSVVNSSSPDVNLHIKEGTTHLTTQLTKQKRPPKPADSAELIEFRKVLASYQKSYSEPTTKGVAIANTVAIRKLFDLSKGDAGACIALHEKLQGEHFRKGRVYWTHVLADFNFNKLDNATPKPTSEREKSASRIVAGYAIADQLEREARAEMETLRLLNDAGCPENRQLSERSGFDGNGTWIEG